MNTSTGVWIGLGVLGAIIIASMGNDEKPLKKAEPTDKPNVEPKKVQL